MARTSRYPSDLADDEWTLVGRCCHRPIGGGHPEKHHRRDVVDAMLHVVRSSVVTRGCADLGAMASRLHRGASGTAAPTLAGSYPNDAVVKAAEADHR